MKSPGDQKSGSSGRRWTVQKTNPHGQVLTHSPCVKRKIKSLFRPRTDGICTRTYVLSQCYVEHEERTTVVPEKTTRRVFGRRHVLKVARSKPYRRQQNTCCRRPTSPGGPHHVRACRGRPLPAAAAVAVDGLLCRWFPRRARPFAVLTLLTGGVHPTTTDGRLCSGGTRDFAVRAKDGLLQDRIVRREMYQRVFPWWCESADGAETRTRSSDRSTTGRVVTQTTPAKRQTRQNDRTARGVKSKPYARATEHVGAHTPCQRYERKWRCQRRTEETREKPRDNGRSGGPASRRRRRIPLRAVRNRVRLVAGSHVLPPVAVVRITATRRGRVRSEQSLADARSEARNEIFFKPPCFTRY